MNRLSTAELTQPSLTTLLAIKSQLSPFTAVASITSVAHVFVSLFITRVNNNTSHSDQEGVVEFLMYGARQ